MAYGTRLHLNISELLRDYVKILGNASLYVLMLHCKENSINVLPEKKLRGLSPNFHIHVSVSDLYIPAIGPPFFFQQNR